MVDQQNKVPFHTLLSLFPTIDHMLFSKTDNLVRLFKDF